MKSLALLMRICNPVRNPVADAMVYFRIYTRDLAKYFNFPVSCSPRRYAILAESARCVGDPNQFGPVVERSLRHVRHQNRRGRMAVPHIRHVAGEALPDIEPRNLVVIVHRLRAASAARREMAIAPTGLIVDPLGRIGHHQVRR